MGRTHVSLFKRVVSTGAVLAAAAMAAAPASGAEPPFASDMDGALTDLAQAPDSALTTASAEVRWLNGWSASITFEGEFSNVSRSYAGKGAVRYQW